MFAVLSNLSAAARLPALPPAPPRSLPPTSRSAGVGVKPERAGQPGWSTQSSATGWCSRRGLQS
ncbi:unnamed protein product [Eretmochelys imbricata]